MRKLVVEIRNDGEAAQIQALIASICGVKSVAEHPLGCCCQHCPVNGLHWVEG